MQNFLAAFQQDRHRSCWPITQLPKENGSNLNFLAGKAKDLVTEIRHLQALRGFPFSAAPRQPYSFYPA
jgi:hypothetical protein